MLTNGALQLFFLVAACAVVSSTGCVSMNGDACQRGPACTCRRPANAQYHGTGRHCSCGKWFATSKGLGWHHSAGACDNVGLSNTPQPAWRQPVNPRPAAQPPVPHAQTSIPTSPAQQSTPAKKMKPAPLRDRCPPSMILQRRQFHLLCSLLDLHTRTPSASQIKVAMCNSARTLSTHPTIHHALFGLASCVMCHVPCAMYHAPCVSVPCVMCHVPRAMHHAPCVSCHAPCTMHHVSCATCHAPCAMRRVSRAMHDAPCTMRHAPCVMCHVPSASCHAPRSRTTTVFAHPIISRIN